MGKRYKKYVMKVSVKGNARVSRTIQIYGGKTLDDLSTAILNAFNFDKSHLYMFSLKGKPFDPEGYYQDIENEVFEVDHKPTSTKIDELALKVKDKFLFLYDFGDDWNFNITVKSITEEDAIPFTSVIQSSGEIYQYGYDEDFDDEDYLGDEDEAIFEEEEISLRDVKIGISDMSTEVLLKKYEDIDNLRNIAALLDIKVPSKKVTKKNYYIKVIVQKLMEDKRNVLRLIPPESIINLIRIIDGELEEVFSNYDNIASTDYLEELCFIFRDDTEEGITINITPEAMAIARFFDSEEGKKRLKDSNRIYHILIGLMQVYRVVEVEKLYELLEKNIKDMPLPSPEEFERYYIAVAMFWDEFNICEDNDSGQNYYINIEVEEVGYVLGLRGLSGLTEYKVFTPKELERLSTLNISEYIPTYKDFIDYLIEEREISPQDFTFIMMNMELSCGIGMEENAFIDNFKDIMRSLRIRFTKKLKNMLLNIREEYPSASLMGYSIKEYNAINAKGRQGSLFD